MCYRHPRFTSSVRSILSALVLAVGTAGAAAAVTDQPNAGFHYDTSRLTAVDISLAAGDESPALLSFYSEGPNGLRLLENVFTDPQGSYYGEMRLPAHLDHVVVVVRTADRQDTLTLAIADQSIAYTE